MAQRAVAEMRNAWAGPDFESIAQRWEQEAAPRLTDVSTALSTMAGALRAQAEEQRHTSGETGSPSIPSGGVEQGGLASGSGGGVAPGDGHREKIEDLEPRYLDVSGDHFAGRVEAAADYSVDLGAHGNLVASAGASAVASAVQVAGRIGGGSDFANGSVGGKAYVGAEAKADASGSVGPDGAKVHLGAEAFAGAKAEVDAGGTLAGVTAAAGAEVSYGVGAHADVDLALSATSLGVSMDLGATLGIGAGAKFDVSVNPQEVMANVGEATEDIGEALARAGDQVADIFPW